MKNTILHIQRMSTEDGPGIRSSVFLKGCSLACDWCHNPESISRLPQVHWIESRCIGCFTCINTCPEGALSAHPSGISMDRSACRACGVCAEECPSNAIELLGRSVETDQLVKELIKDRAYFENSGGGVTITGGEPLMQPDFTLELLESLEEEGIHTALDTCGNCGTEALCRCLEHTDLLLFDIKIMDPALHEKFTGSSNRLILENLLVTADLIRNNKRRTELWIRTPVIPGATATEENIRSIGKFIAENLDGVVSRWELLNFNNLCADKYTRLGLTWPYQGQVPFSKEFMDGLKRLAPGVDPSIIRCTGANRPENQLAVQGRQL